MRSITAYVTKACISKYRLILSIGAIRHGFANFASSIFLKNANLLLSRRRMRLTQWTKRHKVLTVISISYTVLEGLVVFILKIKGVFSQEMAALYRA